MYRKHLVLSSRAIQFKQLRNFRASVIYINTCIKQKTDSCQEARWIQMQCSATPVLTRCFGLPLHNVHCQAARMG